MSKFKGRPINVSLKVIADLSQGLYRSPADALKELISNSYDADSPTIDINFSPNFSSLTLQDIGTGMTTDEFIRIMETIGGSEKRSIDKHADTTDSGRPIVGRIGIGLLGVSQIGNQLEVHSTIRGSTDAFIAIIEFDQFASEEARKIKITELWEKETPIKIGNYIIDDSKTAEKELQFTTIKITKIKKAISDKLSSDSDPDGCQRMMGLKFSTIKKLVEWMRNKEITKSALHEYDRLIFDLCVLCPVPYINNAIKVHHELETTSNSKEFSKFAQGVNKTTHLELRVDGIKCFKPIFMPLEYDSNYEVFFNLLFMKGLNERSIEYSDYDENNIIVRNKLKINGYLYFQKRRIWPPEMAGILIRVRNVAVGPYDSTFINYRKHEGFKFSQVTGEIYVDGLDAALNIDRSSFRETEPVFVAFRDAIHGYLNRTVFPGVKKFASKIRRERIKVGQELWQELIFKNFSSIDKEGRKIVFVGKQEKVVERDKNIVSIATSLVGKRQKFSTEFLRIVSFLEAKLKQEWDEVSRDEFYHQLINWLADFDDSSK